MQVDVHQHIWTEPLLEALSARRRLPFVMRMTDGLAVLHCAGERPYLIDVAQETPVQRARLLQADGLDLAVIALSSPVGIEMLPEGEARELIDAHLDGALELGGRFSAWGPIALTEPDPADVDELIDRGCVGISIPAIALAGPEALDRVLPVLERVQSRLVPLFVHPGSPAAPGAGEASINEPLWWRALTDYVSQMQAAWLTFATYGRRELPRLRTVFAMLAGCAPLQLERLATRGGPLLALDDPYTYYDTSSYGPKAVEAVSRIVGSSQLVYGSDRPVLEPMATGRDTELRGNGAALLHAAAVMA